MRVTVQLVPAAGGVPPTATAVVIDVLRATTTLSVALANGAARVVPVATSEEALRLRDLDPAWLLCGERDGRKIAGFDLGNSPSEYTPQVVRGRTLVFASTNGSLALLAARGAARRVLGSFVNATAVLEAVARDREVCAVCSGRLGRFSLEDAAFAGWLCARLAERGAGVDGPSARLVLGLVPRDAAGLAAIVEGSSHGRYLRSLGGEFARDVRFAGELDRLDRAFEV